MLKMAFRKACKTVLTKSLDYVHVEIRKEAQNEEKLFRFFNCKNDIGLCDHFNMGDHIFLFFPEERCENMVVICEITSIPMCTE